MKAFLITTILLAGAVIGAYAQTPQGPPAQVPPQMTAQDLESQLETVGCKAERQAAAQTIVNLQKQNSDLQKQLNLAKDPPKGGATKH